MKCPKCHFENPDDTLYCGKCSTLLKPSEEISPTKTFETPAKGLTTGTTFASRYEVVEELGKGGMGRVYKALDKEINEEVAIKLLKPEIASDESTVERFRNELKFARKIAHKNVCKMYHIAKEEETPYITMEYVPGEDLKSLVKRKGKLTDKEAISIAKQVCEGLVEAHRLGVVHRDLKPQNIMIDKEGDAKIMDFGIARSVEAPGVTVTGMMIGTPDYISPEQAEGEEADQRSDIYCLGVILYEMVTGRVPFKGDTALSVALKHKSKLPPDPKKLNPEVSDDLSRLILICMEKDRERRHQTAGELLSELDKIEKGIRITVRMPLKRKLKIKWKSILLYGGVPLLLILLIAGAISLFTGRAEAIDSIAVLPFENLTGDTEKEFFVDVATEELIGQLGQISGLRRVISRTSVMKYKETDKSLSEIARELNVDVVVEGSVQQAGDRVRIQVRLIDALPEEQNLWGQTYERAMSDVLVMYGEMARAIADNIQVKLTTEETTRFADARQVNPEAYQALLIGKQKASPLTPQAFDIALEYFELALKKDPNYADAHLAVAHTWLFRNQLGYTAPREAGPKAKAAVLKALELDSTLAKGHALLACVNFLYEWDWADAEAEWKRAIELNPNFGHSVYSHFLWVMKRPEEAIVQMERALQLDPLNEKAQLHNASMLLSAGRDDEANVQVRKLLRTSPQHPMAHWLLSVLLLRKAMYEESLAEMKAYYSSIGDREVEEALTQGYAQSGYRGAMKRAADLLAARAHKTYVNSIDVAALYAIARENAQALEWLEKGLEERSPQMPYVDTWVELAPLRSDPRFQDLLRKMNLPVDEKE